MNGNTKSRRVVAEPVVGTKKRDYWCVCPVGHRFVATVYTAIDLDDSPGAIELLSDTGLQPSRCTACGAEVLLAEAFFLHQPSRRRTVLFIPDALAHRELEVRAEALRDLAAAPSANVSTHVVDHLVIIGVSALQKWLFGEPRSSGTKGQGSGRGADAPPRELHAAFADLDGPDMSGIRSSFPPAEPFIEGLEEGDPLADDDWLSDEAIAAPKPKHSGRKGDKVPQNETSLTKAGRRKSPGEFDFAGLLADDDGESPFERTVARPRNKRDGR